MKNEQYEEPTICRAISSSFSPVLSLSLSPSHGFAIFRFRSSIVIRSGLLLRAPETRTAKFTDQKFQLTVNERAKQPGYVINLQPLALGVSSSTEEIAKLIQLLPLGDRRARAVVHVG